MSVGAENMPYDGKRNRKDAVTIRCMTYTDLKAVMEVELQAYKHPWTIGIFRDCLRVGYKCWVVIDENSIIGYGILMLAAGEAHILNICVKPAQQGQGVGRTLLRHMVDKAQQSGSDMILLEVRRSNQPAIDLYSSENFHELGIRNNYYPADEGREDAIIFAKYLG